LVVDLGLDGQWSLIEPPDLSCLSISSLDNHVSVVDDLEISSWSKWWDDMEWSFDVKSILFVELSLGWFTLPCVNIDNIPLLMDLSVLGFIALNVSSFVISRTLNIEIFVHILFEGSNVSSFSSEQLPPSGVSWCSCSYVWMSTVSVDFHDVVLPVIVENELGSLIESPLSMSSVSWSPSSQVDPVVSVHSDNSLHWHSRSDVEWSVEMESRLGINSLGSDISSIISVSNIPLLVELSIVISDSNSLSFNILSFVWDFNNLVVLDVNELFTSELEDLPPLRVGALDLHLASTTIALNMPWLVVDSSLDCQSSLIEVPDLTSLSISGLNNHVSVVDHFKVSVWFHSWNNMEIFFDDETIFFIEFSLGGFTLPFVNVDNFPLLMDLTILSLVTLDVSSFRISCTLNVKVLIDTLFEGSDIRSFDSE